MDVAQKLGYLHLPENILIDIDMLDKYMPQQVVLVTTGSQGRADERTFKNGIFRPPQGNGR